LLAKKVQASFPEFSSVSVEIGLPNQVTVKVVERKPVLTWRQDGKIMLVDEQGFAFPVRKEGMVVPSLIVDATSPPPPLAPAEAGTKTVSASDIQQAGEKPDGEQTSGLIAGPFLSPQMVVGILDMQDRAPKDMPIRYDAQHGLGWRDPRGWDAYFGSSKDISMKIDVYKALAKQLKVEDIQPVMISVEYVHAPYYRVEK
jgi:hypothetical protein